MTFSSLAAGSFIEQYWPVLVIVAALVVLYVVSMIRRRKDMNQAQQMLNELKPGTKVKTYTGFYGTIDSIRETTDGKVVMLKIGEDGGKVGYIEIDANAIYGIDSKTDVVYDKEGNVIVKDSKEKKVKEEKTVIEDQPKPIKKSKKEKKQEEFDGWSASDIKPVKEEKKKEEKPKKEEK